jgi:hypothetical protein
VGVSVEISFVVVLQAKLQNADFKASSFPDAILDFWKATNTV